VRKVGSAFVVEYFAIPLIHHRHEVLGHLAPLDRRMIEGLQLISHPDAWRLAYFQMQVAAFQLHERTKELIDFQLHVFDRHFPNQVVGRRRRTRGRRCSGLTISV
jgi:hypothetical protein